MKEEQFDNYFLRKIHFHSKILKMERNNISLQEQSLLKRTLFQILQELKVIGLLESEAKYFYPEKNGKKQYTSSNEMMDILNTFHNGLTKDDWSRTIRNAKQIVNESHDRIKVKGSRAGSFFSINNCSKASATEVKQSLIYRLLTMLTLSVINLKGNLDWDLLSQLYIQDEPIAFLTFLDTCIENKMIVNFDYRKDRENRDITIHEFVPVQLYARDGHWVVIGWEIENKCFNQYLFHSIRNLQAKKGSYNEYYYYPEVPDFSIQQFYKNSFSLANFPKKEPYEIHISVPFENYVALRKRKKGMVGQWTQRENSYLWTVKTYDKMEVFSYVVNWNGILRIVGPEDIKKEFLATLTKFFT